MSVPKRKRQLSEYEFYNTAIKLRVEINRLMVSKMVPKAYRLLNALPTVETARSIVYNINRADQFYPASPSNVIERKKYLSLAIADCEQLCLDLQCLIDMGLPMEISRLENAVSLVENEIALLKGARKRVRLLGKRSIEEQIKDEEVKIEQLKELI